MKVVYPVVITKGDKFMIASIPDCQIDTQGKDLADAIEMARDAISLWCVSEQDAGRPLPVPSELVDARKKFGESVTLVDSDIDEYRRKHDARTVRKNLTLPSWLNEKAEKANVNFSQLLQRALKEELHISD